MIVFSVLMVVLTAVSCRPGGDAAGMLDLSAPGKRTGTWWIKKGMATGPDAGRPPRSPLGPEWKGVRRFPVIAEELFPEVRGYGEFTLTTTFDAPPELLREGVQAGIVFPRIGQVFRVYLNGRFMGGQGRVENSRVVLNRDIRGMILPVDRLWLRPRNNQLVITLAGETRSALTGLNVAGGYFIGPGDALRSTRGDRIDLVLIALYLFTGLYHFLLYFKRPGEKYNLSFALLCTGISLYLFTRTDLIFDLFSDSTLIHRVELVVLFFTAPWFIFFLHHLFDRRARIAVFAFAFLCAGCGLVVPLVPEYIHVRVLRFWQLFLFMPLGFPLFFYLAVRGVLDGHADARHVIIGVVLLLLAGMTDVLDSIYFRTDISFGKFAFGALIMGIAFILANRFLRVHNEVEVLNRDLEAKVRERTRRLDDSLRDISALKEKQDGDYYLTSLLVEPLGVNHVQSDRVGVEMYVSQKKKFGFRGRHAEIGGDICAAYNLELQGRGYIVFLNGDAMGKSIQGAAGALVLGTVFKSIVARTGVSHHAWSRPPEEWLLDCFHEIHDVYAGFEGFMLTSAVIGLVDEEDGRLFFANAELPPPVLYRGGRAEFLRGDESPWKIGVKSRERKLVIQTRTLQPDDILITGSDGRDDLRIGFDEQGNRLLNEDADQFRAIVQAGRGRLDLILEELGRRGEPTDDVSLLRIAYREDASRLYEPREKSPGGAEIREGPADNSSMGNPEGHG